MKTKDVVRYAESKGWSLARHGGRHDLYKHPKHRYLVAIPRHASHEVAPGLLATLIKQIDGKWGT